MKKIILYTFIAAIVIVNLMGWLVGVYSDVTIGALFRLALILGITLIATVFAGSAALLGILDKEKRD